MKLQERFDKKVSVLHYARSTREIYWRWIVDYLRHHKNGDVWRRPEDMGADEVTDWNPSGRRSPRRFRAGEAAVFHLLEIIQCKPRRSIIACLKRFVVAAWPA